MSGETSQHDALVRIGASTAEAIAQVLENFAPGEVTRGEVNVLSGGSPFATTEPGTVAAGVSYVDGVTGGNVFLAPPATARLLAARMGAQEEPKEGEPITELELSAISEASNQMMASAAGAIGVVLGQEVAISPPTSRVLAGADEADELFGSAPYATSTTFTVGDEPCRLVQLIPSAFLVRLGHAIDEHGNEATVASSDPADGGPVDLEEALTDVKLRVWAELGRTRLPLAETLGLPLGAVVELDRATEAPVDLYVNGLRFAQGHLLVDDDGRWAIQLDDLDRTRTPAAVEAP